MAARQKKPGTATAAGAKTEAAERVNHWIECDSYDRAALARLKQDSAALRDLEASGGKLLPHFDGFLLDLYSLFFKMNLILRPEAAVVASAGFYRLLLEQIICTPMLESLRLQTALDEVRSGLAAALLGERLLGLLKSERVLTRAEMLDYWSLDRQESEIAGEQANAETAAALQERADAAAQRKLRDLTQRLQREVEGRRRRLERQVQQVSRAANESVKRNQQRIESSLQASLRDVDAAGNESESWGTQIGGGVRLSAGERIDLGRKLTANAKLKKLAQMVGRMRQQARALRRSLFERASSEMYDVSAGAELSRLLPHELSSLRHPVLKRDFARRYVDSELLQYALRDQEHKGRGPMIVCVDGSSSMAGEKEIWSKALSLTLLEIAQRQRRAFRSICFASADTPLQVLDLNGRRRYAAELDKILQLAEYFPGGGTDFQKPLDAALTYLRQVRFRRGDIVFITDGECSVDPQWLETFRETKERLGFALFSVLIDVGPSSLGALQDFSDRITSVTRLTSESGRDVFLEI
jgi:uncharacterized protein with von Willebrand factor type A (vWA) domain